MDIEQLRTLLHQKISDLEVILKEDIQYTGYDYFEDVFLIPNSLTPISIDKVDLTTVFLNKSLDLPLIIAPMTGGSKHIVGINKKLAEFAAKYHIGMGIGDQYRGFTQGGQFSDCGRTCSAHHDVGFFISGRHVPDKGNRFGKDASHLVCLFHSRIIHLAGLM